MKKIKVEMEMKKIKVEWCENFIRAVFRKHFPLANGIEVNCFWGLAEKSGLWTRGTYGSPMSEALTKLTKVETIRDNDGNYQYDVFRLV